MSTTHIHKHVHIRRDVYIFTRTLTHYMSLVLHQHTSHSLIFRKSSALLRGTYWRPRTRSSARAHITRNSQWASTGACFQIMPSRVAGTGKWRSGMNRHSYTNRSSEMQPNKTGSANSNFDVLSSPFIPQKTKTCTPLTHEATAFVPSATHTCGLAR